MKFKLFFGMMLLFASFTSLNAQNYISAENAMDVLEQQAASVESGQLTPQAIIGQTASSALMSATAKTQITALYPSLLRAVSTEIGATKDTALGVQAAKTKLATNDATRQGILNQLFVYIDDILTY